MFKPLLLFQAALLLFVSCKKIERPVLPVIKYVRIGTMQSNANVYPSDHIVFFDANHGVMAGNNYFNVTHDGGQTWSTPLSLPSSYSFSGLSMVGTTCYAFLSGTSGKVYRSTNNGVSWLSLGTTSVGHIGFFASSTVAFKSVWFGQEYGIERSTDGGLNWSNVPTPQPQSQFELQQFYFIDASTGYVVSHTNNRVYTTTDGGINWTPQPTGDETFKIAVLGNRIFHAHADYSTDHITYSDNNGQSWIPATFESGFNADGDKAENISFSADGNLGCALGSYNRIYLSFDRGLTWKYHLGEKGTADHDDIFLEQIKIIPGDKILGFTRDGGVYELIWQK